MDSRPAEANLIACANRLSPSTLSVVVGPTPSCITPRGQQATHVTRDQFLAEPQVHQHALQTPSNNACNAYDDAVGLDIDMLEGMPSPPSSPASVVDFRRLCIMSVFDSSEPFRLRPRRSSQSSIIEFPDLK